MKGVFTALVTPFFDGKVDFESLNKLVEDQLDKGIQGLVVNGTTAESVTLTEEEQFEILDFITKKVSGKVPIVFGSGSNNTEKTISLSKKACKYPIDALLVVVPYYNKPPQEGLIKHFTAVADSVDKPIILYNVPGRTITNMDPETIVTLSSHPNIIGIKEADANLDRFSKYNQVVPDDFILLSGDDESCVEFCLKGGHGVISVCSNVYPDGMVKWVGQAIAKNPDILGEFEKQIPWIQALYISSNPIPTKFALQQKGLLRTDEMRLPLVTMNDSLKQQMLTAFNTCPGIL